MALQLKHLETQQKVIKSVAINTVAVTKWTVTNQAMIDASSNNKHSHVRRQLIRCIRIYVHLLY